jgi:hypothetical protein
MSKPVGKVLSPEEVFALQKDPEFKSCSCGMGGGGRGGSPKRQQKQNK